MSRRILVTGGSLGIGRAIALACVISSRSWCAHGLEVEVDGASAE